VAGGLARTHGQSVGLLVSAEALPWGRPHRGAEPRGRGTPVPLSGGSVVESSARAVMPCDDMFLDNAILSGGRCKVTQRPEEVAYIPKTPRWVQGPATAGGGATARKGTGRNETHWAASIMAPATPCCYSATQKHLATRRARSSRP